jgi:hypothetical protein
MPIEWVDGCHFVVHLLLTLTNLKAVMGMELNNIPSVPSEHHDYQCEDSIAAAETCTLVDHYLKTSLLILNWIFLSRRQADCWK